MERKSRKSENKKFLNQWNDGNSLGPYKIGNFNLLGIKIPLLIMELEKRGDSFYYMLSKILIINWIFNPFTLSRDLGALWHNSIFQRSSSCLPGGARTSPASTSRPNQACAGARPPFVPAAVWSQSGSWSSAQQKASISKGGKMSQKSIA